MSEKENKKFILSEDNNHSPFIIPEGYMDNLPVKVMKNIRREETTPSSSPVGKALRIIRPQLAFAAGFLAFALVIFSAVNFILRRENSDISTDHGVSHLVEYASIQVDEIMLYEFMAETDNYDYTGTDGDYTDLIINYLLKENIEYSNLLTEL